MGFGSFPRTDSFVRLKQEGVKRFHMWQVGREPREIDISVQEEKEFEVSKEYEVTCQLMATQDESECSAIVGGFPNGTHVTILRIGSTRSGSCRLQVKNKAGTLVGWVSTLFREKRTLRKVDRKILDFSFLRTKPRHRSNSMSQLSASVSRLRNKTDSDDFGCNSRTDHALGLSKCARIGETLETEGRVVLRETESMSSAKILTLKGGCQMHVLELGKSSNNRVKVSANGAIGWVTILHNHLNEPLFAKRPHTL